MIRIPQNYFSELESTRIKTRILKEYDTKSWEKFFEDKDAVEFFPSFDLPSNNARAAHWINRQLERYKTGEFGLQAITDKNTNELIGQCGLLLQEVDGVKELEVGCHVFKKYWGNGYAPEAAKLFIDFAFKNNLSPSVISIIHINNIKSQKVALKNGLQKEKQTVWRDINVLIYRISKANWQNSN